MILTRRRKPGTGWRSSFHMTAKDSLVLSIPGNSGARLPGASWEAP